MIVSESDLSISTKIERIHAKAHGFNLGDKKWVVAPLTQEHRDNLVIEFISGKWKDVAIWVDWEAVDCVDDRQMNEWIGDPRNYRKPTVEI